MALIRVTFMEEADRIWHYEEIVVYTRMFFHFFTSFHISI